jgi:hypothetical protein
VFKLDAQVLHVLLVLETSTGCVLGADELLEDLRKADDTPQATVHRLLARIKVSSGEVINMWCA